MFRILMTMILAAQLAERGHPAGSETWEALKAHVRAGTEPDKEEWETHHKAVGLKAG